jgi:predicted nucleic acid-binding protein
VKPIVLDASAAGAWVMPDEPNPAAQDLFVQSRLTADQFHAPMLWLWEMGNMLVMAHVRKRIAADLVERGLELLAQARIRFDGAPNAHRQQQVARLAATHGLTYYDASYLELVLRLNGQLASRDQQLLAAARSCGIVCLSL